MKLKMGQETPRNHRKKGLGAQVTTCEESDFSILFILPS